MSFFKQHISRILFYSVIGVCCYSCLLTAEVVDSNGNGMSDFWERKHNFGQLYHPALLPLADADGDGFSNAHEATAGTNPIGGSPPVGFFQADVIHSAAIYITGANGPEILTPESFTISWATVGGKSYMLQYSDGLTAGNWFTIGTPVTGDGEETGVAVAPSQVGGGSPNKLFWRVAVNDIDTDNDGISDADEYLLTFDGDNDGVPDEWERYISWVLFSDYGIITPNDPALFDVNANYGGINTTAALVYQNLVGNFDLENTELVASPSIYGNMRTVEHYKGGYVEFPNINPPFSWQNTGPVIQFYRKLRSNYRYDFGEEMPLVRHVFGWYETHGRRIQKNTYSWSSSQGWTTAMVVEVQNYTSESTQWWDDFPSPPVEWHVHHVSSIYLPTYELSVDGDPPALTNNRIIGQWTTNTPTLRIGEGAKHSTGVQAVRPVPTTGYSPYFRQSETFNLNQELSDLYSTANLIADAQIALTATTPTSQLPVSFRDLVEDESKITLKGGSYRLGWTLPVSVPIYPGNTQAKAVFIWQEIYDPEIVTPTSSRMVTWKHASVFAAPGSVALTEWYNLPPPQNDGTTTIRSISPSGLITFLPKALLVNKDDDDVNGQEDRSQGNLTLVPENDLIPISFNAAAPAAQDQAMIYRLEATGAGKVRLWAVSPNQAPQLLPLPYKLQPHNYAGSSLASPSYYLEATAPGGTSLKLHAEVLGQKLALLATATFQCLDLGIDFAPNMKGVIGDLVASNRANSTAVHFVSTKSNIASDAVQLDATGINPNEITPSHANQLVEWVGATPTSGTPYIGRVSRSSAGKYPVALRVIGTGQTTAATNVWVTWADMSLEGNTPKIQPQILTANELTLKAQIQYRYICLPSAMFDLTQDVPNFNLSPNPPAPGGNHPWPPHQPLTNGAAIRYDATRQVRAVLRSSDSTLLNTEHALAPDIPNYPSDIAEGNDDPNMELELMPYPGPAGSLAIMRDTDDPRYTLSHVGGVASATFLLQAQFRQYARIQIAGKWYYCSDLELSELKLKFKKNAEMWADDGSSFVTGNGPFPP